MISLYVVADRAVFGSDEEYFAALPILGEAVAGHAEVALQVREKQRTGAARAAFVAGAARMLGRHAETAYLNSPSRDPAAAAGFGGVHWPEPAIPATRARRDYGVGASVHSIEAVQRAERAGAQFAVFGSVFDAGSKPAPGVGTEPLRRVAQSTFLPVLAIGGITPDRVGACIQAGAVGVAVVTGVVKARDPAAAIDDYLTALATASRRTSQPLPAGGHR